MEHDFDEQQASLISETQHYVLEQLILKLSPESSWDDNINGSSIVIDMLETKDFYNNVSRKQNIQKLIDYAFAPEFHQSSANAALIVINALINWYHEKHKNGSRSQGQDATAPDEDDDIIIHHNSDEEEEGEGMDVALLECLRGNITNIIEHFNLGAPD